MVSARKGILARGVGFLTRQEDAYSVNMVRRSIENFSNMLVQQYQSLYLIALGASSVQVGLVNSLAGVGTTITALPAGWAVDRYGLKRAFMFGTLFMAVGTLLFGLANSWVVTIPAMVIYTFAGKINMTSCPVVCGSTLANPDRAVGMQICDSLAAVSGIIAPVVGAWVITTAGGLNVDGIRWVFVLQLGVLGAEFAVIALKFRNPKARPSVATGGIAGRVREVMTKGVAVKRFLLYQSLGMVPLYLNAIYIPLYAAQVKRADTFTLGGMATASLLVPLILSVPSGRLADKFGRKVVVLSCLPLYCLSLVVLYYAPEAGTIPLIVAGTLQGFYTLGIVTGNAIRAEIVPIGLLGSWSGLLGLFGGVVGIIIPVSAGLLWNALSPAYVIAILVTSQLAASAVLLTVPESLRLKREV